MARIGISLNETIRNFTGQFAYVYEKYIGEIDVTKEDITNFNLIEFFKFDNVDKLNNFLYLEAPLEIFGHAGLVTDGLVSHLNNFIVDTKDDEKHYLEIVSLEVDKSIPATLFFLSKFSIRPNNIRFVSNYASKWDGIDILITANPKALELKPPGKISVKVKCPYNKDVKADYEIDSLLDFIKNDELRNQILSTKITNYEEIG